jgi:L-alanine-DL-glutamate epimerase-like enolase superfamily enzyme
MATKTEVAVDGVTATAFRIPTDAPESDGTFTWDATTIVVVEVSAGGTTGLGYTYGAAAIAEVVAELLAPAVTGADSMAVPAAWQRMVGALRNVGRPGIGSMAVSAVDAALWDLKGRLLDRPVVDLLGPVRDAVDVYGSGGFTSYDLDRLQSQLGGWVDDGIRRVKMKVGRRPIADRRRVAAARSAIGGAELFVDANGAYDVPVARAQADAFSRQGVTWFEEPVASDDLAGLARVRADAPAGMAIASGEYGFDLPYFRRMLEAGAVDCLQADATRCGGITGFMRAAALCEAFLIPLSAHCAPSLHAHPACGAPALVHMEYFHDHVRVEHLLFDGVLEPEGGQLRPDRSRPGLGLEFRRADAEEYRV